MREVLWLAHNGVPFDQANDMSDARRRAFSIMFSEFQGAKFNMDSMTFEEPNA